MSDNAQHSIDPDRAQHRRNQVLDAATQCFRTYGFHGCSMSQLARASGMSVGHIYHYFHNKEAIIEAIVNRDLYECLDAIDQIHASPQVFTDMIAGIEEPISSSLNSDNAALQFEILAEAARNPKVAEMVHSAHQHVRNKLSGLIALGSPQPLDQDLLDSKIDLIGALFDGMLVRSIRQPQINQEALLKLLRPTMRYILEY